MAIGNNKKELVRRHKFVYIYYLKFLELNRDKIQHMHRNYIYQEVGKAFYIKPNRCAKIISFVIKNNYTPTKIDLEEFMNDYRDYKKVCEGISD